MGNRKLDTQARPRDPWSTTGKPKGPDATVGCGERSEPHPTLYPISSEKNPAAPVSYFFSSY